MIRFTFLRSRNSAFVAAIGLAVVAVLLAITGPNLVHLYDTIVGSCASQGDCSTAASTFLRSDRSLQIGFDALVVIVPGLIGLFWGAPLMSREIETGTWRLVWTQSVTRTCWLGTKLLLGGLASMAVAGLLSLLITWWSSPVDRANATLYTSFEQRDLVPIGYAAFAFAFGVLVGVVVRKTVPAMAITLAGFVGARLSFTHWLRPHLIAPVTGNFALNATTVTGVGPTAYANNDFIPGPPSLPNAWFYSEKIVDNAGHPLTMSKLGALCPQLNLGAPNGSGRTVAPYPYQDCIPRVVSLFHEVVVYQPASHYWPLQWTELAIYLGVALLLGGISLWVAGRHTT